MAIETPKQRTEVHPDLFKLGLVSFLTDLSSEMVFAIFSIFFTTIAGASAALLGIIEGCADLSASALTYIAGWPSDRTGKRKVFTLAGYGFSTLAKIILLVWLGDDTSTYRTLFWVALVPALLGIFVLSRIKDRPGLPRPHKSMVQTWRVLSPQFKRYLVPAAIFSLAYFSFGFFLLRAHGAGFAVKEVVLHYALYNLAVVASSPLIGKLSDYFGRARVIMGGYLIYALICLGFAFAEAPWQIVSLFVAYGVFYSIDDAQSKAFIADLEFQRRASALGLYSTLTGVIYLPASIMAGALWLAYPAMAFIVAAALSLSALTMFSLQRPDQRLQLEATT
jgi:MFS family permease